MTLQVRGTGSEHGNFNASIDELDEITLLGLYIFLKIEKTSRMTDRYEQSIDQGDYQTLMEIILRFSYFLEIRQMLTDEEYRDVVESLRYELIVRKEPLLMESNHIYLFFDRGAIYRREGCGRPEKRTRIKERTWLTSSTSKNKFNTNNELKQTPRMFIEAFDSYQEPDNISKYVDNLYCCYSGRSSIVLYVQLARLKMATQQRLKEISHMKWRLLVGVEEMRGVERWLVVDKLHKFQYLQVHFGQVLYSETVRTDLVFILKSGLLEIITGRKASGYVVNSRLMLGVRKEENQWARCASERVECYVIKLEDLISFFPSLDLTSISTINALRPSTKMSKWQPRSVYTHTEESNSTLASAMTSLGEKSRQVGSKTAICRRRIQHQSTDNLKVKLGSQSKERRIALRQHFSNFYNQIFDQFSEKKIKQMGSSYQNQQNLNLYQLKVQERKAPVMEEIKNKLRRIRIEKTKVCGYRLKKKAHADYNASPGMIILQQQQPQAQTIT